MYIASIESTWPSLVFLQFFENYLKMVVTVNCLQQNLRILCLSVCN